MKVIVRFFFLYVFLFCPIWGFSQEVDWRIKIYSFFDNGEFGRSEVKIPQTMAGTHLSPELDFSRDSLHSISLGVDILHEYGSNDFFDRLTPTAYYQYRNNSFKFVMGAYPRVQALSDYPRFFFQDSVDYYRPNINGLLLEYGDKRFFANLWLDWSSRQSYLERETFFVGFSGRFSTGKINFSNYTYMYHFAGVMEPEAFDPLHDNILSLSSVGLDLSGNMIFDIFLINGGWAVGMERSRGDDSGWLNHSGFLSELDIRYKWVGLFNSFYIGESQMEFYNDHSNELYWSDPFYRTRIYNRSDIFIDFLRTDFGSIQLIYSLHAGEHDLYHQQILKVTFDIGSFRDQP